MFLNERTSRLANDTGERQPLATPSRLQEQRSATDHRRNLNATCIQYHAENYAGDKNPPTEPEPEIKLLFSLCENLLWRYTMRI
jgi:hypothetical protein